MRRKKVLDIGDIVDVNDMSPEVQEEIEGKWAKNDAAVLALAKQFHAMIPHYGHNYTMVNIARALAAAFPKDKAEMSSNIRFAYKGGEPEIIAQMKKDRD
jgi:hypothetical protein